METASYSPNTSSQKTLDKLEERLNEAEKDTQNLLSHISRCSLSTSNVGAIETRERNEYREPIQPFKPKLPEFQNDQGYNSLISRVCKTESALQTLKQNALNGPGVDLKKKDAEHQELISQVKNYEECMKRIGKELTVVRNELHQEVEFKNRAREEVKRLQEALADATSFKAQDSLKVDELKIGNEKLTRRVNDLKEEVSREKSLRSSLEESHNVLLSRAHEMEKMIESEGSEVQTLSSKSSNLTLEVNKLQDELRQQQQLRQQAEDKLKQNQIDKDLIHQRYETVDSEKKTLHTELCKLKYESDALMKKLEQMEELVNENKASKEQLETQYKRSSDELKTVIVEREKLKRQYEEEIEVEKDKVLNMATVEEEVKDLRKKCKSLESDNKSLKMKIFQFEKDTANLQEKLSERDVEFTSAASGLEMELKTLSNQLDAVTKEKEAVLKEKENFLKEVNTTVNTTQEERNKLNMELQEAKLEINTLTTNLHQLEQENAGLLERLGGFEHHQNTQRHVETALSDMLEQKNKLAYDNGRLQSQVKQLQGELDNLNKEHSKASHLGELTEGLQSKYTKAQKDISDYKISTQCLQNQFSHSQESLRKREEEVQVLKLSRQEALDGLHKLMAEMEVMEDREKRKVESLHKSLEDAKAVNKEITSTLEAVMISHSQLQSAVENLQIDLGKKDTVISKFKREKNKDQEELQNQVKRYEVKLQHQKDDSKKEKEDNLRKLAREIQELKKLNDNVSERNRDLVKANSELRQKVVASEGREKELKGKMSVMNQKIDYMKQNKKQLEENVAKVQKMKGDIAELETLRDQYKQKNSEQLETIQTFMKQISSLQGEMIHLSDAQMKTNELVKLKECALDKERRLKEEMKKKYKEMKKREDEMARLKKETEVRLDQAHNESQEVSVHLNEAHDWFKERFDALQQELIASKNVQSELSEVNKMQKKQLQEEKVKSWETAQKAKKMLKESHHTMHKLANYTSLTTDHTKKQAEVLKSKLKKEKEHAKVMEDKHQRYVDASSRQFQQLLKEMDKNATEDYG